MIARFDPAAPSRRRWVILSAGLTMLIGGVAMTGAVRAQAGPVPGSPPASDHAAAAPAAAPAAERSAPHAPLPKPIAPADSGAGSTAAVDHEGHGAATPARTSGPGAAPADATELSSAAQAELQTLELELKAKTREFEVYQAMLKRMEALNRQGSIGTAEVDKAEIEAVKAEAEMSRAKLRLEQFRTALRPKPPAPRAPGSTTWDEHAPPAVAAITPGPAGGPAMGGGGNFGPGAAAAASGDELNIVEDETTRSANAAAAAKLRTPIGNISFDNVGLSDALANLATVTKLDILADWQAIEGLGLAKDSAVTLKLSGQFPAEHVIRWTLRSVGGDGLGFWVDHGVVTVTSQDRLNHITLTRMYDAKDQASKELIRELKTLVSPGSWRESGGLGAIVSVDDRVLITQTGPNHRQIESLLTMVQSKDSKTTAVPVPGGDRPTAPH
jgi:hypothetical protein